MSQKRMRNDISGLRALAVIPVLLFHAKIPFVSGGFLGVDLFFVISGYLITGDIVRRIQSNTFSFISFYDRRARRILPALLLVIAVTSILAPLFMVPYDIKNYGQSVVASIFAANNILLWMTSGYWSHAAEFKPLYHTWSLGVEEQYYFVIPLLLFFAYGILKRFAAFYVVVLSVLVISFVHSLLATSHEYNFLIIFTRAWELMAGGALAVYLAHRSLRPQPVLAFLGLCLVLVSFVFPYVVSSNQALVNLLPVLGAFIIIGFSDERSTFVGRILAVRPMVFIGLISYSVYLWHQPLIAFFRLASEYEPDPYVLAAVSLLSIPLAYLSWRFVENPARNFTFMPAKRFYPALGVALIMFSGLGLIMHKTYGFQKYFDKYSYDGDPQSYVDAPMKYTKVPVDNAGKSRLVVLGNSFARDFINVVEEFGLGEKYEIVYDPTGCSIDVLKLGQLLGNARYVVLANNWAQVGEPQQVYDELLRCVDRLSSRLQGRKLFVFGAKNFGWNNNFTKMLSEEALFSARTRTIASVYEFNALAAAGIDNYIDILYLLYDAEKKVPMFTDDNRFITYDTNHLTKPGARYLGKLLFEQTPLAELKEN